MPKKKREKKVSEEEAKLLAELKRLMLEGRRAQGRRDLEDAKRLFRQGQQLALEADWEKDADVFKASILIVENKLEEVISLLLPTVELPGFHLKGHAYDRLGVAQNRTKLHVQAVASYLKALEDPGYDTLGWTLTNIGIAYCDKGEYDKGIEYYKKALKIPNYDTPGDAWHNMGLAYYYKREYDKAIEYFEKALKSPNYDTPGHALFNMGISHMEKEELDQALKWLKRAREWFADNEPEKVERVDSHISSIKQQQKLRERGLEEAAEELGKIASLSAKEPDDPLGRIRDILDENRNRVEEHATQEGTRYKDVLAVLKGWSSSIPIVSAVDRERFSGQVCYGGGYFIKAGTQGIVIDPGLDFVTNFGTNGEIKGSDVTKMRTGEKTKPRNFHIKEITQVVVSHHHIDHYVDITRINDLDHQLRNYDVKAKERESLHYYFDSVTYKNHSLSEVSNDNIHPIDPSQPQYSLQGDVKIYPFPTQHRCQSSFGCVLEVKLAKGGKRRIGYTSDMSLFKQSLPEELNNCDIIIAHFSYAEPDDFAGKKEDDNHLGYTGLKKLIQGTDAKLYVISEFWGGRGDYRIELAQKLRYDFKREGREVKIIPGDVGCLIGLRELNIRCSSCGEWVSSEEIVVTRPEVPFGRLRYLCKKCRLG